MTIALILKELRQHWLALLLVAALLTVGFAMIQGVVLLDLSGSRFEALRRFLILLLPLGTLVICNRLVVREYQSRTQLFLEALPISRVRMIVVKYLLGLILVFLAVGLVFGFVLLISLRTESLTGRFLAIVAARSYTFSWCLYSLLFIMGLMGRYRVAIYLMGILGLFAVDTMTQLELSRFGPFALVDERFPFERLEFPRQALAITGAIAGSLTALTLVLSLTREGSVATLLAERMSHREKVTVTVLILGFLFGVTMYDERVEKKPFDLPDSVAATRGDVTVKVGTGGRGDPEDAQRLAEIVATEAAAMQEYLDLQDPPPIFIIPRRDLDAHRFERGVLDGAEGLLVRANFRDEDWEDGRFVSWLLREMLLAWSDERLAWEPNLWVLDGFPIFWLCRDGAAAPRDRDRLELRSAYGATRGFSGDDATGWLRYRERVGDEIAAAVAWRGLESIAERQGPGRCRDFLRAALDTSVPADVRGTLHDWVHPPSRLLAARAGVTHDALLRQWSSDLNRLAEARRSELTQIPRIEGEIQFDELSEHTRMVRYRFQSDPPPDRETFSILYTELPAFDDVVPPTGIRREDSIYPAGSSGELPGTYGRGTRFFCTFATWVEPLGCEIISGWQRREMP